MLRRPSPTCAAMLSTRVFALPFLLLALGPFHQEGDADVARARGLMGEREEGPVTKGAQLCIKSNSVPAVEALLEVMSRTSSPGGYLPPAHYRDIAWGALRDITDAYARKRVEQELRESKDPRVRQWCAELLGLYGDGDFGEALSKALRDKEDFVVQAAARALGRTDYKPGTKGLEKLVRNKDLFVRANAIEALARLEPEEYAGTFEKALGDKDGGVRCALLGAAHEIYPDKAEAWSALARAEDADWRPRAQAVDNLGRTRTKTAVDALIPALDDGRPVVGVRALKNLQELTGQQFTRKDQWDRWWSENRESFAFPEGRATAEGAGGERTVAIYNGIEVVSDHVAFLIDKSQAMTERLSSKSSSKDDAARGELEEVLGKLGDGLVFNVFCYELRVYPYDEKRPVTLSKKTTKGAVEFVDKRPCGGQKDIWQVLEVVVGDPDLDTAYLLSSGEPDTGLYVHWNRVTWQLDDLNRFHKVVVHSVAYSDNEWYRDQLEKISEVTGGQFQWFE